MAIFLKGPGVSVSEALNSKDKVKAMEQFLRARFSLHSMPCFRESAFYKPTSQNSSGPLRFPSSHPRESSWKPRQPEVQSYAFDKTWKPTVIRPSWSQGTGAVQEHADQISHC